MWVACLGRLCVWRRLLRCGGFLRLNDFYLLLLYDWRLGLGLHDCLGCWCVLGVLWCSVCLNKLLASWEKLLLLWLVRYRRLGLGHHCRLLEDRLLHLRLCRHWLLLKGLCLHHLLWLRSLRRHRLLRLLECRLLHHSLLWLDVLLLLVLCRLGLRCDGLLLLSAWLLLLQKLLLWRRQ